MAIKKKSTAEKGLATIKQADLTVENIPEVLKQVKAEIASHKGGKGKKKAITESLGQFGKVSDIKDVMTIRAAYAYITRKGEAIVENDEVFKAINSTVKLKAYTEGGATVAEWQEELKERFADITFEVKLKKLKAFQAVLEENVSKEEKLKSQLSSFMTDLSED